MDFLSLINGNVPGTLEASDLDNPQRTGHYADDYILGDWIANQEYFIKVTASDFDADLQLINSDTGELIAEFNDYADKSDTQFSFAPQTGINYAVRVTSKETSAVGSYTLSANEILPVDLELSLLVDISPSVDDNEYALQINGYADAFDQVSLYEEIISQGLNKRVAINFILWSGETRQEEVVGWTLIDSVEASKIFAQNLREATLPEFGGQRPENNGTAPGSAIDFADDLFSLNSFSSSLQAIEVSGDGDRSSVEGGISTSAARTAALTKGVDVINGVVIEALDNVTRFYQTELIGGTNADGSAAFVKNASTFDEFSIVIRDVLERQLTPRAFFSAADAELLEGSDNSQLVFTVSLSKASNQSTSIDFSTVSDSAVAGLDFVARSGTLVFLPGETSKTVAIDVIDDVRLEAEENLLLSLSSPINADLSDVPGTGTIIDNDTLQLSNAAVDENAPPGTVIGALSATDANDPDPFTFSLVANAGGRFAISDNQLQVADGSQLDFEASSSHNVTVQAVDSAGNTFEQVFEITINNLDDGDSGNPPSSNPLQVTISAPSRIGVTGTDFVTVTYTNTGNTDIPAPLLSLAATGAVFTSIDSIEFTEESIQFLGINNDGLAGVLPAGVSNSLTIEFQPTAGAGEQIDFSVSTVNPDEVIDWQALRSQLKPDYLADEAWNDIYDNFVATVGNTAGDYEQLLIQNANYLSEQGEYVADANRLVGFEFQQASDFQSLAQRNSLGSFGRGRFFIGDIQASTDADGNVAVVNSGTQRSFALKGDGTYAPSTGDYGTLTLINGVYTLTEQSGTQTVFRPDGQLDFIEDTNGNRITGQYSNEQLTGLVATNGDSLTFTRNSNGFIDSITDSVGQVTTTYDYEGELLKSISAPEGTVSHTYNDDFSLASITDGDRVSLTFDYYPDGRLLQERFGNGAEQTTYSYGDNGEVFVEDADGNTTQLFLNDRGQISQLTDALGRTVQIRYDENGNPRSIAAPENTNLDFRYDDEGNLETQIDALGGKTEFTYEPSFNLLQSVTDPRENAISYDYDDFGNLEAITYADDTSEGFEYNDRGLVEKYTNRRGQTITYGYNDRDQLFQESSADGTTTYTYDSQGNLDIVTDNSGVTDLDFADGRLLKITYPTGRSLAYTYYSSGRRQSMTDQDGNQVNYTYDEAGRLKTLTDADNNLIVSYTYDEVGRLRREDNGNGTYTIYTYDPVGQLTSIFNYAPDNSINSSFVYDYDDLGQQTEVITLDGTWTYSYDPIGQLTGAVFASTNPDISDQNLSYEYDAAGNRIRTIVNGETTEYTTNNLNQYENAGAVVYDYDDDGNLRSKTEGGNTWTYEYNSENRLVRVVDGTSVETRYEYDALGNRIATIHDGGRTEYLVDPYGLGDVVAEYDGTGGLMARYTHGIGLVSRDDGNASAFYDSNAIGSTVGLTNGLGAQVNSYSYLPFGIEFAKAESIDNPFEFVGQWGVMEEANGLNSMRARFYDSDLGRFLSPDPIGLNGGDSNLYRYVENNPTNLIDPEGKFPILVNPVTVGVVVNVGAYLLATPANKITPGGLIGAIAGGAFAGGRALIPVKGIAKKLLDVNTAILSTILGKATQSIIDSIRGDRNRDAFGSGNEFLADVGIASGFALIPGLDKVPGIGRFFRPTYTRILNSISKSFGKKIADELTGDEAAAASTDVRDESGEIPSTPDNQARSKGEPHLTTFDGIGYSFQGAGDFTLVESLDGDLNIQVRYVEIDSRATVATAVATLVDGQRVVIDSGGIQFVDGRPIVTRSGSGGTAKVTVDGEVVEIPSGGSITVGNSQIFRNRGEEYTIVYAGEDGLVSDGDDQLTVNYFRPGTINIVDVALRDEKKGQIRGLLGNLNDDPDDDVALLDGTPLPRPLPFDQVYGAYRDDWRVKDVFESLFDYAEGQSPNTFYNPNFPASPVRLSDLDFVARARGEAAALKAGYIPGTFEFISAAFDFAITGDPAFLEGRETDPGATDVALIVGNSDNGSGNGGDNPQTPLINFAGADIQLQVFSPSLEVPSALTLVATVDEDIEFDIETFDNPISGGTTLGFTVDFTDNSIIYQSGENPAANPFFSSADFNGFVFTDIADSLPNIEGVSIDASSTTIGIEASDIAFTEDSISINFEGTAYTPGEGLKLDVTFADPPSSDDAYEDNDAPETAYDLTGAEGLWLSDLSGIGIQADDDWYRIDGLAAGENLMIDLQFEPEQGDIDLELLDADLERIAISGSFTEIESISVNLLTGGTYYIQVYGFGENTNITYDLQWSTN